MNPGIYFRTYMRAGATTTAVFFFLLFLISLPVYAQQERQQNNALLRMISPESSEDLIIFKKNQNVKKQGYFTAYKSSLGLSGNDEMRLVNQDTCSLGMVHYAYQQYYKGIPVFNASYILHEKGSTLESANGNIVNGLSLSVSPGITESAALVSALGNVDAEVYNWEVPHMESMKQESDSDPNATYYPKGQLVIFQNDEIPGKPKFILTWKFDISSFVPHDLKLVMVDASTGEVLISDPQVCQASHLGWARTPNHGDQLIYTKKLANNNFVLHDEDRGGGIHTRDLNVTNNTANAVDFIDANNDWNNINAQKDEYAPEIHWGMLKSYDYFEDVHARKGFDNNDMKVNVYVHNSASRNNAGFFNPPNNYFSFGDVYDRAGNFLYLYSDLQTVSHEFGHGVNFHSLINNGIANGLRYRNESGAINEGYADIWAALVENKYIGPDSMYLFGYVFYRNTPGQVCDRDLKNPNASNPAQPDTYGVGSTFWHDYNTNASDNGGVHVNNSIASHWFYLLAEGGHGKNDKGKRFDVEGIGILDAEKIVYRALTVYHNNWQITFNQMRAHTIQAAEDLFCQVKAVDPCCRQKQQVINAWYAVGLGDSTIMIDTAFTKPSACDSATGSATVSVVGVKGTPTYMWSNDSTTATISKLETGTYSVTITDTSTNCTTDTSLEVKEEANFKLALSKGDPNTCKSKDGWVQADPTNITGTPKYLWSTGDSIKKVENLNEGTYSVTVTDTATKCVLDDEIELIKKGPKVTIKGGGNRTFCRDAPLKEVLLSGSASNCPGCKLKWSTGEEGYSTWAKYSGTYTLTATSSDTCSTTESVVLKMWEKDCDDDDNKNEIEIPIIRSSDPNDITGPAGYGQEQFINATDAISYLIRFENDPDFATAAAQKVVVTVPLHPNTETFTMTLGDFGFGDFIFSVPAATPFYTDRLDVVDSLGVYVDIVAGIDVTKGEAFWIFQSIDPLTGLEPSDPTLGFLLVNDSITHRGEGFVNFTISPLPGVQTGDTVSEKAAIVFDDNETIPTNVWKNTFDALPPTSKLDSLPEDADSTAVILHYAASDDPGGSGVGTIEIYYAFNGSIFQLYGSFNADSNIYFDGQEDVPYDLFSIAIDNTGNREAMKTSAETTVILHEGPQYAYNLEGIITYDNAAQTPMNDVAVVLEDADLNIAYSSTSDASGQYSFIEADAGLYNMKATTNKAWGSCNAIDALMIARHFLGFEYLSPLRTAAANVNGDGTVNAADAQLVLMRFADLLPGFSAGDWHIPEYNISLTDSNLAQDIQAICFGDVNGSHIPGNKNHNPTLFLKSNDEIFITDDKVYTIPLTVNREVITGAISLIMYYPKNIVEIGEISIPGKEANFKYTARNGVLRIAWYDIDPLHLYAGDVLLNVDVRINKRLATNRINFTMDAESQIADSEAIVYQFLEIHMPKLLTGLTEGYSLENNIPNPFNFTTEIPFTIAEDAYIKLSVFNMLGELVEILAEGQMNAGRHHVIFNGKNHNAGLYFYKLEAKNNSMNFSETKRMIITGR